MMIPTTTIIRKCTNLVIITRKSIRPLIVILLCSGIGRLVFGKLSDVEKIARNGNRIILQQIAFVSIGIDR